MLLWQRGTGDSKVSKRSFALFCCVHSLPLAAASGATAYHRSGCSNYLFRSAVMRISAYISPPSAFASGLPASIASACPSDLGLG